MRVITYLLLLCATSVFSQEIMISGTYQPNTILISNSTTLKVDFVNEDFVKSVLPGTLTLTIEYPNSGVVVIPVTPPYGAGAAMFSWVKAGNVWTGTNLNAIAPFTYLEIYHDLIGLDKTTVGGVSTILEVNLNPSSETNIINNFAYPLLAIFSSFELSCNNLDTVYLTQDGMLDLEIDSLFEASTLPNCEPIETDYQDALDLLDCTLDIAQDFTIYVNDQCNGLDSCSFNINLIDTFPPQLTCFNDTTVYIDANCEAYINFDTLVYYDNCGLDTLYNNYKNTNNLSGYYETGSYQIKFFAHDFAGNIDSCSFSIEVLDTIPPTLNCTPKNIGLAQEGTNTMYAKDLINHWDDNCKIIDFAVLRMESPCNPEDLVFNEDVEFCCEDVDSSVMLVLQVTDVGQNKSTCMIEVTVSDNLLPTVEPLPNITVSCDVYIDLKDLSAFGELVKDPLDRADIIIKGEIKGQDGLISDNCDTDIITIDETYSDERINFQGDIIRYFEINDHRNNQLVLTKQTITVVDNTILTEDDITFPNDTTIIIDFSTNCVIDPSSINSGEPIIQDNDICTMPAIMKEDLVFGESGVGCAFIKRTWMVIDMAQHDPNKLTGQWTNVQYITLENHVAPVLDSVLCSDRTICLGAGQCEGIVDLDIYAEDDCTDFSQLNFRYLIDLDKDGIIEYDKNSNHIEEFMTQGTHFIIWKVEDKCGNISKCEFDLTVKDCKAPVPFCYNGITLNLSSYSEAEIWASDLNAGSYDNCTSNDDLIFAFNETLDQTNMVFTCLDLGLNTVGLHVADENGNQSICNATVTVNEGDAECTSPTINFVDLNGFVQLTNANKLSGVEIEIEETSGKHVQLSDNNGEFLFKSLEEGSNISVRGTKNDDCLNGVSTLDLVMIQRHILGINPFTDSETMLAADVNNSNHVNASDLVELRKLLLGVSNSFESCDCWAVMNGSEKLDAGLEFESPFNYTIRDDSDLELKAVKIGDVNRSATGSFLQIETDNRGRFDLAYDVEYSMSQSYLNFFSSQQTSILGFQTEMNLGVSADKIIGIQSNFFNENNLHWFITDKGTIRIVAYASESIDLLEGSTIFKIILNDELINIKAEIASPSAMNSEIYLEDYSLLSLQIKGSHEELLVRAFPNPYHDQINVYINKPLPGLLKFSLIDATGKTVYQNEIYLSKGENSINLIEDASNFRKGVYYILIESNDILKKIKVVKI